MEYSKFIEKVGKDMDVPTNIQNRFFIEGEDSIHFSVALGYVLANNELVARDIIDGGELFIGALGLLESRGAKRGEDYILTTHFVSGKSVLLCSIHTTHDFLCDEDFDDTVRKI